LSEVADSLVVHVEDRAGGPGEIWLFVVKSSDTENDESLVERIRVALRDSLSPRHVPDQVIPVPGIPRTLSGKKLEVPVKRILAGADPDQVLTLASVANPESLEPIFALARGRREEA
jgi:acetoacetyl-CoA synthetase